MKLISIKIFTEMETNQKCTNKSRRSQTLRSFNCSRIRIKSTISNSTNWSWGQNWDNSFIRFRGRWAKHCQIKQEWSCQFSFNWIRNSRSGCKSAHSRRRGFTLWTTCRWNSRLVNWILYCWLGLGSHYEQLANEIPGK